MKIKPYRAEILLSPESTIALRRLAEIQGVSVDDAFESLQGLQSALDEIIKAEATKTQQRIWWRDAGESAKEQGGVYYYAGSAA